MIERSLIHVHSSDSDNDSGERTMISADDVVPSVAFSLNGKVSMLTKEEARMKRCLILILLLCSIIACAGPGGTAGKVAASSEERISSPAVAAGDLGELAKGNNAFAFDLYQALCSGKENLLFSPYSLSQALAMTYAGARGETAEQMAEALHFTLPQERLHPAFNALDLELASRSHAAAGGQTGETSEDVAFELNVANSVWGQDGLSYVPEYLDVLAQNYGAGIRLVDFVENPDGAVRAINQWIGDKTSGRIQNLVPPLPSGPAILLTNATYFNARWDLPFQEESTYEEPFHLLDGRQEPVPMMHQTNQFQYTEGDGYQAIQLPYRNREVAMVILLPQEGRFREIEGQLSDDWVQDVLGAFDWHEVILTMPKFGFETAAASLREILSAMGMADAFSRDADFFGIIEPGSALAIYIADVAHKAFIDVDEQRTEAAAAAIVIVTVEVELPAPKPTPIEMKTDRPFLFLIRDIETDTILFAGRVMNPASQ